MEEATTSFTGQSDIGQQVLDDYGKSVVPQHRRLCETADAIRTIIKSQSLPLTPLSYFSTIIDTSKITHRPDALSSLLAIVLPLVPGKSIDIFKAAEATRIVAEGLRFSSVSVWALVESLGVLLELCDLDDWESVQLGFETLIKYSIDTRLRVRKCAQGCVVKLFKSIQSCLVKQNASKLVLELFKTCVSSADDQVSKCAELEVIHMLELLEILLPFLPSKFISEAIVESEKIVKLSPLRMHVLDFMCVILIFIQSKSKRTFVNTVKIVGEWSSQYTLVLHSIAGHLTCEATAAARASRILKKVIKRLAIFEILDTNGCVKLVEDVDEVSMVESLCNALTIALGSGPNEHSLGVISRLYQKLGKDACIYMSSILPQLANCMKSATGDLKKHLWECIGSAVIAMGSDEVFALFPITLDDSVSDDLITYSNTWLIPVLKDYAFSSSTSLMFFTRTILPLAESFQKASQKGTLPTPWPQNAMILELASSFVGAATIDPDLIYNFIKECLQEEDDKIQTQAYAILYKILEESSEFRSSKFKKLMDFLLDLKSPITSRPWRFSCFKTLLLHSFEITYDGEENTHGSCLLNQIIETIDSDEESRIVAHNILLETSSILQKTSQQHYYYEFIDLSLHCNDSKICHFMPDLVPQILDLLDGEVNIQVISAVLEFIEVLALNLQEGDLHNILPDILGGLVPWLLDYQHPSTTKVPFILEIIMQKCGYASLESYVPYDHHRQSVTDFFEGTNASSIPFMDKMLLYLCKRLNYLAEDKKEDTWTT